MTDKHSGILVALHWFTAVLIVANVLLGLSMVPLPISPRKLKWYAWHKWIGGTVFLVTWVRLAWRGYRPVAAAVPMPAWQRHAAMLSHTLLYVLLIVVPLSGWIYSSATGVQVVYLGLVPLPDLVPKDKALADSLRVVHVALNTTLVTLVAVHAAAALKHHFFDGDPVLARMAPWIKQRKTGR